uniref:Ig-like domain-containing protein n=1 Tax=Xenopus tropicalis TaxID=8364 RepID=A0A6I8T013_XENTR
MERYLLTALFSVWINLIYGINIQPIPEHPVIDQPVTLSVSGVSGAIHSFSWYRSSGISNSSLILSYNPTSNPAETQGPKYFPRASSFSNGSLHIVELSTTDSGYYTVQVQAGSLTSQYINLPVYVPVVKPVIRASSQRPVEYDEVALTCTATNAQRFLWSRIGGKIPSGVKYSSNNSSMTISRITLSDAGKYQCEGMNPVFKDISETYTLSLYCVCADPPAGVLAGIICGTIAGIALIACATFLLYRRFILPARQVQTGQVNSQQKSSEIYDNVIDGTKVSVCITFLTYSYSFPIIDPLVTWGPGQNALPTSKMGPR